MAKEGKLRLNILDLFLEIIIDVQPKVGTLKPSQNSFYESEEYVFCVNRKQIDSKTIVLNFDLKKKNGAAFQLQSFKVSVTVPILDIHHVYVMPLMDFIGQSERVSFMWGVEEKVSTNHGAPLIMGYNRRGENRFFMGFMDQKRDTIISQKSDHVDTIYSLKRLFDNGKITTKRYIDSLYISTKDMQWHKLIKDFVNFHDQTIHFQSASVPDICLEPTWCSWYALRHDINHDNIIENARVAKELGIGTIIMDYPWHDGFCEHKGILGASCGDWVPDKKRFPNLKKTMNTIQDIGLAAILWVAPFLVGPNSYSYRQFQKLLRIPRSKVNNTHFIGLCPLIREVHDHVAGIVRRLMKDYAPDGLKIDFLDAPLVDMAVCKAKHKHDYETIGHAMEECLQKMYKAIMDVNPGAWIEFRQNYANINNRAYANCFRSQDAPRDPDQIRRLCTLLRLHSAPIPVHADYGNWHPEEKVEDIAKFLGSLLMSGVPTFSVDLTKLSKEQYLLIKNWLKFYHQHKKELVFGDFVPLTTEAQYPINRIINTRKAFFGIFSDISPSVLQLDSKKVREIYIINGTNQDNVNVTITGTDGRWGLTVFNKFLEPVKAGKIKANNAKLVIDQEVEQGGLMGLRWLE